MGFQAGHSLPGPTAMLRGSEWPFPAEGKRREFLLRFFAESRLGEFDLPPPLPSPPLTWDCASPTSLLLLGAHSQEALARRLADGGEALVLLAAGA